MRKRERGRFHTSGPPRLIRYLDTHVRDSVPNEKKYIYIHIFIFVKSISPALKSPLKLTEKTEKKNLPVGGH